MSDHYSIYCESVSYALVSLLDDLINKKITDEDFSNVTASYKSVSGIYLTSLKLLLLKICCKEHFNIHQEEINQVSYLVSILTGDHEIVKSNLIRMYNMGNSKETMH